MGGRNNESLNCKLTKKPQLIPNIVEPDDGTRLGTIKLPFDDNSIRPVPEASPVRDNGIYRRTSRNDVSPTHFHVVLAAADGLE